MGILRVKATHDFKKVLNEESTLRDIQLYARELVNKAEAEYFDDYNHSEQENFKAVRLVVAVQDLDNFEINSFSTSVDELYKEDKEGRLQEKAMMQEDLFKKLVAHISDNLTKTAIFHYENKHSALYDRNFRSHTQWEFNVLQNGQASVVEKIAKTMEEF